MLDLAAQPLVAIPAASLAQLRTAVTRDGGDPAPFQEAGYAAGEGLYDAFVERLRRQGVAAPESLDVTAAQDHASAFFRESGWGEVRFEALGVVVAIDSDRWMEADSASELDHPGCFFSTGLLAGFFGRLADAPLAALEVECRSMGAPRCRFLLGSVDALDGVYQEMAQGGDYNAAVRAD
jgi:predicted hydrocarbon binding protein